MLRRHPQPLTLDWPPPPLVADRRRWGWLALTAIGFFLLLIWTFRHDDPAPGLSERGWATITLAALLLVLLSIHRAYGPAKLARALAEYAVVALLAVLLTTTSGAHPPGRHPTTASAAHQHRPPAVIQAAAGVRDWLAGLWRQATQQAEHAGPTSTTRAHQRARALSPTPPLPWNSTWRSP